MGLCCSSRGSGAGGSRPSMIAVSKKTKKLVREMDQKSSDMERQVNEIIARGEPFTDSEFPPRTSSLYDPQLDEVDRAAFDSFQWKRASQIYNPVYIFEDGVEPNDIN